MIPNPQDPPHRQRAPENPMFDLIPHRKGATNQVPSFIQQYGPIREVRFVKKPDGTPDGGVHQLFTVVGRSDIGTHGCTNAELPPTDFESEFRGETRDFGFHCSSSVLESSMAFRTRRFSAVTL